MRSVAAFVISGLMLLGSVLGYGITPASAVQFTGTYFQITNPGATGQGDVGGISQTSALNTNVCAVGKFLCNPFGAVTGTVGSTITPITGSPLAAGGHWLEANTTPILLWTVHDASGSGGNKVALDKTSNDTFFNGADGFTNFLDAAGTSFFPTSQGSNASLYRAVHWTGLFSAPAGASFTIQSDDHAFLFVDGALEVDAGGIKSLGQSFFGSLGAAPGNHTFDLFFADVFRTDGGLRVACEGCLDPVPEPTSLLLFGTTLAGLGAVVRRKFRRKDNTV